jgi:hypothetical protein
VNKADAKREVAKLTATSLRQMSNRDERLLEQFGLKAAPKIKRAMRELADKLYREGDTHEPAAVRTREGAPDEGGEGAD